MVTDSEIIMQTSEPQQDIYIVVDFITTMYSNFVTLSQTQLSETWYATKRGKGRSIPLPFCVWISRHQD